MACPGDEETTPEEIDVVDIVPLDNEISGWTRSSDMRVAENATQLQAIINGEAESWTNNGFVKFVQQFYEGDLPAVTIELRIADMGDSTGAQGIYDDIETYYYSTPIEWTDNPPGDAARYEMIGFSYLVDFRDDKFHTWISISENSDAALNIAQLFALNISSAIHDTTQ